MAANTDPIFVAAPIVGLAHMTAANTGRDGTGTTYDVVTGSTNGTRVDRVVVKAQGTTTAGMVRLFIYDGTNVRFLTEAIVTAITVAAATKSFEYEFSRSDGLAFVNLPSGYVLRAATHNAETFDVLAFGGNY